MQRLIQCSSSCFSHGQTTVCASSLLACMGFISARLRGIEEYLFTNQFCAPKIPSMITNTHSSHTLILHHLCNFCKIITASFEPDAALMRSETVFIPSIPTWGELSAAFTRAVAVGGGAVTAHVWSCLIKCLNRKLFWCSCINIFNLAGQIAAIHSALKHNLSALSLMWWCS